MSGKPEDDREGDGNPEEDGGTPVDGKSLASVSGGAGPDGASGGAGATATPDKPLEPLLDGWAEHLDITTDRPMWYNARTRATSWFRPTASAPPVVKGEWMEMWDPAVKQRYYFNTLTRQSQWHLPSTFLEGMTSSIARKMAWMEIRDPRDGRMYYFNKITRKVQWRVPKSFEPVDPPEFPSKRRAAGAAGGGKHDDGGPKKPRKRYTGHLFKQGGGTSMFGKKNWKERFVVMEAGCLAYYKNEASFHAGDPPLKGLYLTLENYDIDPRPDQPVQFTLIPNAKAKECYERDPKGFPHFSRSYDFQVSTPAKKTVWLDSVAKATKGE